MRVVVMPLLNKRTGTRLFRVFGKWGFYLLFVSTGLGLGNEAYHRLQVEPLDFQDGDSPFVTATIAQLEAWGQKIYIRSRKYPELYLLDLSSKESQTIGGQGDGPSELGYGFPMAMAVRKNEIWVVDGLRKSSKHFVDGTFKNDFRLQSYAIDFSGFACNSIAFSDGAVVIPCDTREGALALAYHPSGEVIGKVGDPIAFGEELLQAKPFLNDTIWLRAGENWFAAFKYYPMILVFDDDFQELARFPLKDPLLNTGFQAIVEFQPNQGRGTHPNPIISDFKYFKGRLYLMGLGVLFEVDPTDGQMNSKTGFYGIGDHFGRLTPEKNLPLDLFAFLGDGRLILAHIHMLWGHDLWTVEGFQ